MHQLLMSVTKKENMDMDCRCRGTGQMLQKLRKHCRDTSGNTVTLRVPPKRTNVYLGKTIDANGHAVIFLCVNKVVNKYVG